MHFLKTILTPVLLLLIPIALLFYGTYADAGDTLIRIKAKDRIRCGVSDGIPGFSIKEPDGRWSGLDADFCRALASAFLGDPDKVDFIPLTAAARFSSLKAGEIDVLVRNTTWTLEREAVLELMFPGILYFDGQGFLVPVKGDVNELSRLNGATICVVKGTTHEANLSHQFRARNWAYQPLAVESNSKAAEALFSGQCQAYTSEHTQLRSTQLKAPGGADEYLILPDQIAREPMGPVVRRGDDEWFTIVRWVLFALIKAEETGLTQSSVGTWLNATEDPVVQRWLELDKTVARALSITPGWATRTVENVGNYGEMFERNLGAHSSLKLDRGLNRLWTQGGLLFSPPFR